MSPSRSALVSFGRQLGWSFSSKVVSAALQLVVIVLLARGLAPAEFAWVASANVVMMAVVAINGFGLIRQIQYRRAIDRDDPALPAIFDVWQGFTLASAALWLVACLALYVITDEPDFVALLPIALWLALEQVTTLWNAVSLVDGRARDLMPSYLYRRGPVVVALAVGLWQGWDVVWCWSLALAFGATLAYAAGVRGQEAWARRLLPRRRRGAAKVTFDLGYWWTEVGAQVRDLDTAVISLVSAATGGLYGLPARLVRPMNLVTVAATSVAFPRIARLPVVTTRQLFLGCTLGSVPVALMAGVVAAFAGLLPSLVGDDYADAVPTLRVLCLAAVVGGFGALVVTFLQARSRAANRFTGYVSLAVGVVQVTAGGLGAYFGDATTAAWAATLTAVAGTSVLYLRAVGECRREAAELSASGSAGQPA
ncbi:MAG: hypothetical protein Q7J48_07815 [Nocardioides sp.]|nr:hypothetical protein [Nocardioides sp.]